MSKRGVLANGQPSERARAIYTIGSSNRGPKEFLALLRQHGVQTLVDVRRFPTSRLAHFQKEPLAEWLQQAGLRYVYLGEELGGYRSGGYEAYLRTEEFARGLERLEALAAESTVAMMCAERFPWKCHRRFIGRVLQERGWKVIHIIDEQRVWIPR